MKKYKLHSQLSEEQIADDVSNYLGQISPFFGMRYKLESVDEQKTGADRLFNRRGSIPIYMQFKVSQGLEPRSYNSIINRFLNTPLPKIIKFRKDNNLNGNPILYFKLRKQANTALDLQHNILEKMHNPPYQYGLYIAPLTLFKDEYEEWNNAPLWHRIFRHSPFSDKEIDLTDPSVIKINLSTNPFLRNHISIPPHCTVQNDNHHYSYSNTGNDLAWHGGKVLDSYDYRLSSQLFRIISDDYVSHGDSYRSLISIARDINDTPYVTRKTDERYFSDNPWIVLQQHADYMRVNYKIRFMLLSIGEAKGF